MEAIWTTSFKIRVKIEVRKLVFWVLLRRRVVSALLGICSLNVIKWDKTVFTAKRPVIFLKYFFEFVCNKTLSAFNGARRQKCHMRGFKQNIFYKLDEHPLVAKWWWNDPPRRICWVRLWNMLIVFYVFLPFLLWLLLLFCFISSFIFIYFLFLIGYRSSFSWHSASAARGSTIHVFLASIWLSKY